MSVFGILRYPIDVFVGMALGWALCKIPAVDRFLTRCFMAIHRS